MSPSDDVFMPLWRSGFVHEQKPSLSGMRELYARVTERHRNAVWSRPDAIRQFSASITEIVREYTGLPSHKPLRDAVETCQRDLLTLETQIFTPIARDLSEPIPLDGQIALHARLCAQEYFLDNEGEILELLTIAICDLSCAVIERAPPAVSNSDALPLISTIAHAGNFVDAVTGIFLHEEYFHHNLFMTLNRTYYKNLCAASGAPADAEVIEPLIWPSAAKMPAAKLVHTYLAGMPLHALLLSPYPFSRPDD